MPNLKPLTKQRWIITVNGGTQLIFDELKGVGVEYSTTDFNDGTTGQTKTAIGFVKNSAITLGKVADEDTDAALRSWVKSATEASTPFDMSYQAVTVNKTGSPVASYQPITATQCRISKVKYPEVERTSSDLAKWEIEIIVNGDVQ